VEIGQITGCINKGTKANDVALIPTNSLDAFGSGMRMRMHHQKYFGIRIPLKLNTKLFGQNYAFAKTFKRVLLKRTHS
jgi:hypothetical protein